jgi:hypothetical protein
MPPASPDDIGFADRIEQRRLAVVDVTHDGDDRRPRLHVLGLVLDIENAFLDIGLGDAADGVAEFLGDEFSHVGVDQIARLHHLAFLHQELDHVDGRVRPCAGRVPEW